MLWCGEAFRYRAHMQSTPSTPGARAQRHGPLERFFRDLGPGLITGAADDDPSGISTYSVAGAAFGYTGLWTALFSFPLMAAVQLMCARLGMVTGRGLAAVIRTRYPRPVLWFACALLIIANMFNIGADLGGMADAVQMVTGIPFYLGTPFFPFLITGLLFWTSYRTHSACLQRNDARFICLCDRRISRTPRLVAGDARNIHSTCGMDSLLCFSACWNLRNDDFAVSLFLAGGAGS